MRVLLTGAGGQLGTELQHAFADCDVVALDHQQLDVSDEAAVSTTVYGAAPDVVVHAASFTKVDACETQRATAWEVNALGALWVARACAAVGATMVLLSTDYVFDGTAPCPYTERDATHPLSVYGRTKEAAEELVRATLPAHYIVRTAWLQGVHGQNFVKTILKLADERPRLAVVDDQTGSPTFAFDLAPAIRRLVATGQPGTYHLTNRGACTWFELALRSLADAGLATAVDPIDTAAYGAPAPRPSSSVLDTGKAAALGIELPAWQDSLRALVGLLQRTPTG